MTKAKLLMSVCFGVLLGTGLGSVLVVPRAWLYAAVLAALLPLMFRWSRQLHISAPESSDAAGGPVPTRTLILLLFPYVVMGAAFGCWRVQTVLAVPSEYGSWYGEKQDFEAVVVSEADVRQDRQLVTIQPKGYTQRLLVTTTLGGRFFYGDLVWVRGKVVEPKAFDDFDYPGYLARFSTTGLVRYPKMIVLKSGQGNSLVTTLLRFKSAVVQRLLALYSASEGNFLLGVLIGAKRGLAQEVLGDFARTGTSHVLAVSGFNISIFITALGVCAYVIGRRLQLVFSLLCVLSFVIIAGPSASVIRAAGMGTLLVLATTVGRLYNPLPALLLVAASMVVQNPRILFWDVGFQLSAAATAGILLGVPLAEKLYGPERPLQNLVQELAVTLSAIFATLPISLLHFGQLSVVAPVANILVVPLMPLVMALGALSLVPFFGSGFAWLNGYVLHFCLWVLHVLARPSWASLSWSMTGVEVCASYAVLVLVYIFFSYIRERNQKEKPQNVVGENK